MIERVWIRWCSSILLLFAGTLGITAPAVSFHVGPVSAGDATRPVVLQAADVHPHVHDRPEVETAATRFSRFVSADTTERDHEQEDPSEKGATPDSTRTAGEDAWTLVTTLQGIEVKYIHYIEADNHNDGVVIRLRNQTACSADVRFTVVFRSEHREVTAPYATSLAPWELKTGESAGLFWIPFPDGESVGEVGLRGLSVELSHAGAPPNNRGRNVECPAQGRL